MLKYEIFVNEKGEEKVRFEGYEKVHGVFVDKNGYKYFSIPNMKNPSDIFKTFLYSVKDAYDAIKDGDGDVLLISTFFIGNSMSVIRYIDKEYGESLRQQFLDGWKNAQFKYCIRISGGDMYNSLFVTKNYNLLANETSDNLLLFDTEKEAIEEIEKIKTKSKACIEKYNSCTDDAEIDKYLDELMNEHLYYTLLGSRDKELSVAQTVLK